MRQNSLFLFIVVLLIFLSSFVAAQDQLVFQVFTPASGLSRNVRAIIQDRYGFLWIGTEDGLFKFDGYSYKAYYHEAGNRNTLSNSTIQRIIEDHNGFIWIATQSGGLNCLNPFNDSIKHYVTKPDYISSMSGTYCLAVYEDKHNNIWFGTQGGGLYCISAQNQQITNYRKNYTKKGLCCDSVCSILEDSQNNIWVGTQKGLNIFDKQTKKFRYVILDSVNNPLETVYVYRMIENPVGTIWLATQNQGLYKYEMLSNRFTQYKHIEGDNNTIQHNAVNDIIFDKNGLLWIATDGGVSVLDTAKQTINTYKADIKDANSLSANSIWNICIDKSGILWFACVGGNGMHRMIPKKKFEHLFAKNQDIGYAETEKKNNLIRNIYKDSENNLWVSVIDKGLFVYNTNTKKYIQFERPEFSNNYVTTCYEDHQKQIWFGTWNNGIYVYNPKNNKIINYNRKENDSTTLGDARIQYIHGDRENNIWIGTDGGVLSKFDRITKKFANYRHNPNDSTSLSWGGLQSMAFFEDNNNNLWLGSWGGVTIFNKKTGKSKHYNSANSELSDDRVISIHGNDSIIWFGTYGGGLNKLELKTNTFTNYLERHGLPNNTIFAILSDNQGNLWLSTVNGLSKFNPRDEYFQNFTKEDGLQENEFYWGAAFKDATGKLYFGGTNGLTAFVPEEIIANQNIPNIVINEFKIFNQLVLPNTEDSPLTEPIYNTKEIEISSLQYIISFSFVALDFTAPEKNKYAYKMDGFDKEWIYTKMREVTYMNLKPGEYVFQVKACNSEGVWNESGTRITLIITPPFWETYWFKISIALFIIFSIILISRLRIKQIEQKKIELEKLVTIRTSELNQEKELLKRANQEILFINEELQQQKEEITAQRDNIEEQNEILTTKNLEIEQQKTIIEIKSNSITESINYAAKIQKAILTPTSLLDLYLKNYFILYRPKDIISGDFYFVKKIDNFVVVVVADCTGHGVPGAFMSVLGITLLNEQLRDSAKLTEPHTILNQMRSNIILSLRQTRDTKSSRDGMDITLCAWNQETDIMYYAAAYHKFFVIRQNQLLELSGDKMPIGIHMVYDQSFTSHSINLEEDDTIYLFSDGYSDQFDSKQREKFYFKNFRNLILETNILDISDRQEKLASTIDKWRGNVSQVDDITVLCWQISK